MTAQQVFWQNNKHSHPQEDNGLALVQAMLTATTDGMAVLDHEACFILLNSAFARLFGIEGEKLTGISCIELFARCGYAETNPQKHNQELETLLKALRAHECISAVDVEIVIQDVPRILGVSVTPIRSEKSVQMLLVVRDITVVREATKMKANVLSMIAHELRSPLNSINGYLDLVLANIGGELNKQQREFVQRARMGSEHLYTLLEDLLVVSRVDAGQLRLNRELVHLSEIVEQAVEELELTVADHHMSIDVDIPDALPRLYADPVRLQQILRNLLNNAVRFSDPQGRVLISAYREPPVSQEGQGEEEEAGIVILQVQDTGIGIAPEYHTRIFERFFQVPREYTQRAGGQGLGLAIVKMLVELHGGGVAVTSIPRQGSTFLCRLPCILT